MFKNIVESGKTLMTMWRMHIACWIPMATNTLRICNTYCFSTATMVTRSCLGVTLQVNWVPYLSTLWNLTACVCQSEDFFKVLCYGENGNEYYCLIVCVGVYCFEYSPISQKNPLPLSLGLSRGDGGSTLLQNGEILPNHAVSHLWLH
jgi:hypothetical protein